LGGKSATGGLTTRSNARGLKQGTRRGKAKAGGGGRPPKKGKERGGKDKTGKKENKLRTKNLGLVSEEKQYELQWAAKRVMPAEKTGP